MRVTRNERGVLVRGQRGGVGMPLVLSADGRARMWRCGRVSRAWPQAKERDSAVNDSDREWIRQLQLNVANLEWWIELTALYRVSAKERGAAVRAHNAHGGLWAPTTPLPPPPPSLALPESFYLERAPDRGRLAPVARTWCARHGVAGIARSNQA